MPGVELGHEFPIGRSVEIDENGRDNQPNGLDDVG